MHHTAQSRRRTRPVQKVARTVSFYSDRRRRCFDSRRPTREKTLAALSRSCVPPFVVASRRVGSRSFRVSIRFVRGSDDQPSTTISDGGWRRACAAGCTRLASRNAAQALCLRRRKSSRKLFKWRARVVLLESEPVRLRLRAQLVTLARKPRGTRNMAFNIPRISSGFGTRVCDESGRGSSTRRKNDGANLYDRPRACSRFNFDSARQTS